MTKTSLVIKVSSGLFLAGAGLMLLGLITALLAIATLSVFCVLLGFVLLIIGMLLALAIATKQISPVNISEKAQTRADLATDIVSSLFYLIH